MSYNFENFYNLKNSNGDYTLLEPFEEDGQAKQRPSGLVLKINTPSPGDAVPTISNLKGKVPTSNLKTWIDASIYTGQDGMSVGVINNAAVPSNVNNEILSTEDFNIATKDSYKMYGNMLPANGADVVNIIRVPDGRYAFITEDGGAVKMALSDGTSVYYYGNLSQFDINKFNTYPAAPAGSYGVRLTRNGQRRIRNKLSELPTVLENALNGMAVFDFTSQQKININPGFKATTYTLAFVARQMGPTKRNGRLLVGRGNKVYGYWDGKKEKLFEEGWILNENVPSDDAWDIHVITKKADGSITYYRNGGGRNRSVSLSGGSGMDGLFVNQGDSACCNDEASDGQLAEVLLWNSALTEQQITDVESYLAVKWGLVTSMNTMHPIYKELGPPIVNADAPMKGFPVGGLQVWADASKFKGRNGQTIVVVDSNTYDNANYFTAYGSLPKGETAPAALPGTSVSAGPVVRDNAKNGLSVLTFTPNTGLQLNQLINYPRYTMAFLSRQIGGKNGRVVTSKNNKLYGYHNGGKNKLYLDNWIVNENAPSDDEWDLYIITRNSSGENSMSRNGKNIITNVKGGGTLNGLFINRGDPTSDGEASDCELAEMMVWDRVLGSREIVFVQKYFGSKWDMFSEFDKESPLYQPLPPTPANADAPVEGFPVTNLQLWADASKLGPLVGKNVAKIISNTYDQKYNFINTSGTGPSVIANGLNKLPVLNVTNAQSLAIDTDVQFKYWTMAFVARQLAGYEGKVNNRLVVGRTNKVFSYLDGKKNQLYLDGGVWVVSENVPSDFSWDLYVISRGKDGVNFYRNGRRIAVKRAGGVALDGLFINKGDKTYYENGRSGDGQLAEFLLWDRNITDSEVLALETYLAKKWNLQTDLDEKHPAYLPSIPGEPNANPPVDGFPVSNLLLWTDATQFAGKDKQRVSVVESNTFDKSLSLVNTDNTGPIVRDGILNDLPVLHFNTDMKLRLSAQFRANQFTLAFVSRHLNKTNRRFIVGRGDKYYGYGGGYKNVVYSEGWVIRDEAVPSNKEWDLYVITRSKAGITNLSRNGKRVAMNKSGGAILDDIIINSGTGASPSEPSVGQLAEFLFWDRNINEEETVAVEGYLASKWGLRTALDSSHPYRLTAVKSKANATAPSGTVNFPTTNLELWSDASTLKAGNITSWASNTIRKRLTWELTTNQPVVVLENQANQLSAIRVDSNRGLGLLEIDYDQYTIAVVMKNLGNNRFLVGRGNKSYGYTYPYKGSFLAESWIVPENEAMGMDGNWDLFIISRDKDGMNSLFLNGKRIAVKRAGGTGLDGLFFNQGPGVCCGSYAASNGLVGEVLIWNREITDNEVLSVETYLAKKWGLTGDMDRKHPAYAGPTPTTITKPIRYIRIGEGGDWFGLSQVAVYDSNGINIALNKPVTAARNENASGITNGKEVLGQPGMYKSGSSSGNFVEIDLQQLVQEFSVKIYNRNDYMSIQYYKLIVLDSNKEVVAKVNLNKKLIQELAFAPPKPPTPPAVVEAERARAEVEAILSPVKFSEPEPTVAVRVIPPPPATPEAEQAIRAVTEQLVASGLTVGQAKAQAEVTILGTPRIMSSRKASSRSILPNAQDAPLLSMPDIPVPSEESVRIIAEQLIAAGVSPKRAQAQAEDVLLQNATQTTLATAGLISDVAPITVPPPPAPISSATVRAVAEQLASATGMTMSEAREQAVAILRENPPVQVSQDSLTTSTATTNYFPGMESPPPTFKPLPPLPPGPISIPEIPTVAPVQIPASAIRAMAETIAESTGVSLSEAREQASSILSIATPTSAPIVANSTVNAVAEQIAAQTGVPMSEARSQAAAILQAAAPAATSTKATANAIENVASQILAAQPTLTDDQARAQARAIVQVAAAAPSIAATTPISVVAPSKAVAQTLASIIAPAVASTAPVQVPRNVKDAAKKVKVTTSKPTPKPTTKKTSTPGVVKATKPKVAVKTPSASRTIVPSAGPVSRGIGAPGARTVSPVGVTRAAAPKPPVKAIKATPKAIKAPPKATAKATPKASAKATTKTSAKRAVTPASKGMGGPGARTLSPVKRSSVKATPKAPTKAPTKTPVKVKGPAKVVKSPIKATVKTPVKATVKAKTPRDLLKRR